MEQISIQVGGSDNHPGTRTADEAHSLCSLPINGSAAGGACLRSLMAKPCVRTAPGGVRWAETACVGMGVVLVRRRMADVVLIRDVPGVERLTSAGRLLGDVRSDVFPEVREIAFDPARAESVALSLEAFNFHIDGTFARTPPRFLAMQYVVGDQSGGGASTFAHVPTLLGKLRPEYVDSLRRATVTFTRAEVGDGVAAHRWQGAMLARVGEEDLLRWREDRGVAPVVAEAGGYPIEEAIESVRRTLAAFTRDGRILRLLPPEGSIVLFNNYAVLHGREALVSASRRLVRRLWI